MRKCFWFFVLLSIASIFVFWRQQGKWDRYYQNKAGQPPRELVAQVLSRFSHPGIAIDLGSGIGNESGAMVNQGWTVYAVDQQAKALAYMQKSADLIPVQADFTKASTWNQLPKADLIFASYALPFVSQNDFIRVWTQLCGKLSSGGRFAGHFFGPQFQGFLSKEVQQMTFFSRNEVLELFQGFEIEHLEETEQDDQSGTGQSTHSHIFEVIARKK
jgi:hypothetical protein